MFQKIVFILLFLPYCIFASTFKDHLEKEHLKFIQTNEDNKRLGFYSALFDMAAKREKPAGEIPKILHFIWLGPDPFPKSSIANINGWIDHHPGWKVRFWTDQGQSAPDDRMEVRVFDMFPLEELKEMYFRSDNFGERSQLLRYAILMSEGGIYIDHDVTCLKSIELLANNNDFFCGMETLGTTVLSSSVNASPHLIASTAQHPILKSSKKWLLNEWDRLEAEYPGTDPALVFHRVQHRTFRALSIGIRQACAKSGRKDVVFPPNYFSLSNPKNALYTAHAHAGSWHQKKDVTELKAQRLLAEVMEESTQAYWMSLLLAAINGALGVVIATHFLRKDLKKKRKKV